jgi:hypothetical protein
LISIAAQLQYLSIAAAATATTVDIIIDDSAVVWHVLEAGDHEVAEVRTQLVGGIGSAADQLVHPVYDHICIVDGS